MKKIYISQISDYITESIEEDFYLKTIHLCHTKETGTPYLFMELEDKSGKIEGRIWENNIDNDYVQLKGKIVKVNGEILFNDNNKAELICWKIEPVTEYDIHQFIKGLSPEEEQHYINTLQKLIELVSHSGYRELLNCTFNALGSRFYKSPLSLKYSGSYNGALLVQTVAVTSIALQMMRSQKMFGYTPNMNIEYRQDLLITGSLLCDIGVANLYTPFPDAQLVSESVLVPPSALTMQQIYKILPDITNFLSEEEKNLLIHMIQVVREDTRKRPMFREALILSIAYNAYNKIRMLDYHLQENQNEYGAIYDTSLKNYLYIAKELKEEDIQNGREEIYKS